MIDANLGIKRWEKIGSGRVIDRGGRAGKRRSGHRVIIGTFLARGGGGEAFVARFAVLNGVKSIKV